MLQQGLGWLRWSPDEFWSATMAEFDAAVSGYMETRGVAPRNAKAEMFNELREIALEAQRKERKEARRERIN